MNTNNTKRNETYRKYNQSFAGRLRTFSQLHFSVYKNEYDERVDNFTAQDLEDLWYEQNGLCACCGREIEGGFSKADIGHKLKNGLWNKINFQILHRRCNFAQAGIFVDFIAVKETYGYYFTELWNNAEWREFLIQQCFLGSASIKKFDKLVQGM